ncbi:unnamed protein product [Spirodela intermedia]|uniref:TCP domain-containing protein n=1 Tax=Spirodela intermedia TaxID=51605 RepID=A0A7I8IYJ4_SPIIN|nr:unnamed protein product [Spirodela intermedia]CAA6662938.1 unnamed protein product [Spirodela intermedia]
MGGGAGDPRIVRVSRSLGGKDRHSKVTTVRGLRDRRVRLSVPTAVQLYDLQERLGLSQPSKVVDWLLDAARHEIDKLPPLPFPPEDSSPSAHRLLRRRRGIPWKAQTYAIPVWASARWSKGRSSMASGLRRR